jgi:hypothetical protein
MSHSAQELYDIAAQGRLDFETGTADAKLPRILKLYVPQRAEDWISDLPLLRAHFPKYNCDLTAPYLRHQYGWGELLYGYYDGKIHTVLDLGKTVLADETIADITADQFGGPTIYVGPLVMPWERQQQSY